MVLSQQKLSLIITKYSLLSTALIPIYIKVNGYTLRGSNTVIFMFASPKRVSHFLKEKTASFKEFASFKVHPFLYKRSHF